MTLVADVAVAALPPSTEEQAAEVTASEGLPRDSGEKNLMIGLIINIHITDHSTYYLFNVPPPPLSQHHSFLISTPPFLLFSLSHFNFTVAAKGDVVEAEDAVEVVLLSTTNQSLSRTS